MLRYQILHKTALVITIESAHTYKGKVREKTSKPSDGQAYLQL